MNMETIKAIVSMAVVVLVQVSAFFGVAMEEETMTQAIFALVGLVSAIVAAWRNHNFTKAAQVGQKVTDAIKAGEHFAVEV